MAGRVLGPAAVFAALAVDQASKALVSANVDVLTGGIPVVPGFDLVFHRNEGVIFGLLQGVPWWALAVLAIAVVLYLGVCLVRSTPGHPRFWPMAA